MSLISFSMFLLDAPFYKGHIQAPLASKTTEEALTGYEFGIDCIIVVVSSYQMIYKDVSMDP